jgi:hypothetical protein
MLVEEPDNINCYAVVVNELVDNVIMWDGVSEYETEVLLVEITGVIPEPGIGWSYIDGEFVDNRLKTPIVE